MSQAGGEEAGVPAIQSHSLSLSPLLLASPSPENGTYWDGVGDDDYGGDDDDDDGDEG